MAADAFLDAFRDPEEAHRAGLIADPGNQFLRPGDYGMFFAIPLWWRSFIFWVLTPAEFMAYAYLCSQTSLSDALAFPTGAHFKADLRRTSKTTIYRYIKTLVHKGFFCKQQRAPFRNTYILRNVYQRPAPEYTLIRLLELNLIDADLRPAEQRLTESADEIRRHTKAIQDGLRHLLTQQEYEAYSTAKNAIEKRGKLLTGLKAALERRRDEAKKKGGIPGHKAS